MRQSLALLTDLYQITMANGYWKAGKTNEEAVFHLFFRKLPFGGGYAVACGLAPVVEFLRDFHFSPEDIAFLATLRGADDLPLFEAGFLEHLGALELAVDVDGIPEGTVVFPHEPLLRIQGPILHCQLLETALLTFMNFNTLIATKAARVCLAAQGETVLEFGLRRAQGADGGLAASRAAYVGGVHATSNVLAGRLHGIPVRGTHAHSWVMSFDSELEAFESYAEAMPNNCVFLVDTYDTLEGVRHAVQVGTRLRERGHEMVGIRLDSGDLAWLSIEARRILDAGGFPKASIVASNDLDERLIGSLKDQGATISVWGVGTKLITAYDQPALGGVYKLSAVRKNAEAWKYRIKLSEQAVKITNPGVQQVRRFKHEGVFAGDMIYDLDLGPGAEPVIVDPMDPTRRRRFTPDETSEDLLVPVMRSGRLAYEVPPLSESRARTHIQLENFHAGIKRLDNPHQYPVGLEQSLFDMKTRLILQARGLV